MEAKPRPALPADARTLPARYYMMTHTIWPLAPDRTRIVCEWHFQPDELERSGFDARDVVEFWDLTNRQDWHVCELAQAGISSRA